MVLQWNSIPLKFLFSINTHKLIFELRVSGSANTQDSIYGSNLSYKYSNSDLTITPGRVFTLF